MTMRTSRRTVTFARPFSLRGIETEQPAGTYAVETDEELLEGLSFPAYRRLRPPSSCLRGRATWSRASS